MNCLDKETRYFTFTEIYLEAALTEEKVVMFRHEYVQPMRQPRFIQILPKYFQILPKYFTGFKGIYAADTEQSFSEDRSLNESIRIAGEIVSEIEVQH